MNAFNEEYRFGSADWASAAALKRVGLFGPRGPLLGYSLNKPLRLEGDAPIITIGGAGSGKLRDVLAYTVCGFRGADGRWWAPPRLFVNDSRGELCAISIHNHVRLGKAAYVYNPFCLHRLPQHRVNLLDILNRGSKSLHADAKLLAAELVALSGGANGEYFELRARQWIEAFMLTLTERDGGLTLAGLYDLVNAIEDPRAWAAIGNAMLASKTPEVKRTAIEIDLKRGDAPKEYGAIMGEIAKSLAFLSDPAVRDSVSGADFSLDVLCRRDCTVFSIVPAEYAAQLAPLNRLMVGAAMLYKFRAPAAPRVLFLIDEAATLGRFEALLRGYSYGRGMGVRMWSIWQDIGQIARNYGRDAVSGFLGSSQTRQFFGVRDLETARLVSAMLGNQTIDYDPPVEQAAARRDMRLWAHQVMNGGDPFEIGLNFKALQITATTRIKQARPLMTPDEILCMPEDRQILFISGLNLNPVYAAKHPYFTRAEMVGGYMPNPYHPPGDTVRLAGGRWGRVIIERVPGRHASLPQYQSGQWSYIAGYRPA